jgi:A/G-specific adenine glycosylase
MNFSNSLIQWYLNHKRDLPWRNTQNPYLIWLSEIILQQTRVAQGTPYYMNFTNAFPTVFDLANATEEQVLKLWQGLGYYSRARNLHKTAQYIAFECNGIFPNTYSELIKLKGVGEYTAAAIASFSFDEVVPVVDGNVFRVLARYFDIETDISQSSAKKEFTALAVELISQKSPAIFNQAIMEFGALQCVPKNPNCSECVFNSSCLALKKNKINQLPVKNKKTKVTKRYFNYLIYIDNHGKTPIRKRTEKGIWHNLYEFPILETLTTISDSELVKMIQENQLFSNTISSITLLNSDAIVHKLSHQYLTIKFWRISVLGHISGGLEYDDLIKHPFPIVIYNFIENNFNFNQKNNCTFGH